MGLQNIVKENIDAQNTVSTEELLNVTTRLFNSIYRSSQRPLQAIKTKEDSNGFRRKERVNAIPVGRKSNLDEIDKDSLKEIWKESEVLFHIEMAVALIQAGKHPFYDLMNELEGIPTNNNLKILNT